ncbi:prenyltransferase [Lysinimonas soli]|uniref:Prenyltransferase n=1 Tax=Lysinimonas soli TaxID=1074233 RepID=A0ABW0NQS0_9MICO
MIRELVLASRPVSWINTAYPFAAAYLVTTGRIDAPLIVGTVFFLIPYNLAMYGINDVFDYESDLANPRKGGAEGAVLTREAHAVTLRAAVLLSTPFVITLIALSGPWSWGVLTISLFAVVAYSVPGLRLKERPFLDSLTSSVHFVSPAVFGLALAGASPTPASTLTVAAFLLWGIASHAFGAVQDVVPDRAAGISSIATAIGARWTVRLAIGVWVTAGLVMLLLGWPGRLAAFLVVPYIALAMPYWSVSDADSARANRGWKRFLWVNYVVGFFVTVLLIVSSWHGSSTS